DDIFEFDRNLKETMAYANIHKNGSMNQREQLSTLELGAKLNTNSKSLSGKLAIEVAEGIFPSTIHMLKSVGQTAGGFLEIMMDPVYDSAAGINPIEEENKKRKKRKKKGQSRSINR